MAPPKAVVFDLDDTLLDTSALREAREDRDWLKVMSELEQAEHFEVETDEPPVITLPAEIRDRSIGIGVLTHSPRNYAEQLLALNAVKVDAMVTGSDGYPTKPDPTGLKAVISELGIEPDAAIYVGDSIGDFGAAAVAGTLSAGVAWDGKGPGDWTHVWPDAGFAPPSRLLRFIEGEDGLRPWGEVIASGESPVPHWGSVMRLGDDVVGLGRYFPTSDRRHPHHALSKLVLKAKDDKAAAAEVAKIFGSLAEQVPARRSPDLILSVPPDPDGGGYDRFVQARDTLSAAYGAADGGGRLRMLYGDADYKHASREARSARNVDRFDCDQIEGGRVLLIDDVYTSGGQSRACSDAILGAGASSVTIMVLSVTQDSLPEPCPECGANLRTLTRKRDGKQFVGCSAWFVTGCPYTRDV